MKHPCLKIPATAITGGLSTAHGLYIFLIFVLLLLTTALTGRAQTTGRAGSLDTSFNGSGKVTTNIDGLDSYIKSAAVQPDGKIVVAGYVILNEGIYKYALARFNSNGSLDNTFDGDGRTTTVIGSSSFAESIVIQPNGKIVVAGVSSNGQNYDFAVVRYNENGSLDTSFDGDGIVTTPVGTGNDLGYGAALTNDGRIVVAGYSFIGQNNDFAIVRYNPDGSLDNTFDQDGKATTQIGTGNDLSFSVAVTNDDRIVAAGYSFNSQNNDFALVRYNSDGSLDNTFDGDGKATTPVGTSNDAAFSLELQTNGKIVAAGFSLTSGQGRDFALVRYNANGSLDNTFDNDGKVTTTFGNNNDTIYGIVIQQNNKIVAAGFSASNSDGDSSHFALTRYNPDGSLDTSFDNDGRVLTPVGDFNLAQAHAVALQPNGRIVAAGDAYISSGQSARYEFAVTRYLDVGITCATSTIDFGTIPGSIEDTDCAANNRFYDDYVFNGVAGQQIAVAMNFVSPPQFGGIFLDPYLELRSSDGTVIASNDNTNPQSINARIPAGSGFFTLPANDTYTIRATTSAPDDFGDYTLTLISGSISIGGRVTREQNGVANQLVELITPTVTLSTTTNENGFYVFNNLSSILNYVVRPLSPTLFFTPPQRNYANQTTTVTNANFAVCTYALNPTGARIGASGGTGSFTVSTQPGCPVNVSIVPPVDWLTAVYDGDGLVNYVVQPNSGAERSAAIYISGQTPFIVQQDAGLVSISGQIMNGQNAVAGQRVRLSNNSPNPLFTTTNSNGVYSFNNLPGGGSYTVQPENPGLVFTPALRTYPNLITNINNANFAVCTYTLNPTEARFGANGGNGSFNVITQSGCPVTASAISNPPWLTNLAVNNLTVSFTVQPNSGTTLRNATISISGQQFFGVTQSPPVVNCIYSLNRLNTNLPNGGRADSFLVRTDEGCPWEAVSDSPSWIQVMNGENRTGTGTVNFIASDQPNQLGSILIRQPGQTNSFYVQHFITQSDSNRVPPNDNFENSQVIPPNVSFLIGNNTQATVQAGEPRHANQNAFRSIWYSWTAPGEPGSQALYSLTTAGSTTPNSAGSNNNNNTPVDTRIAVYTGDTLTSLTPVAANEDATVFDRTSRLSFLGAAGTTYRIAVDANGAGGTIQLNLKPVTRLYRFYALTGNGYFTSQRPVITARAGNQRFINAVQVANGTYEINLPADNLQYRVTIEGQPGTGIVWSPREFVINNSADLPLLDNGTRVPVGADGAMTPQAGDTNVSVPRNSFHLFIGNISNTPNVTNADLRNARVVRTAVSGPYITDRFPCAEPVIINPQTSLMQYRCETLIETEHVFTPVNQGTTFEPRDRRPGLLTETINPSDNSNFIVANTFPVGNLSGVVLSNNNVALNGALVRLTRTDNPTGTPLTVTSRNAGEYEFDNIEVGTYSLTAELSGYEFPTRAVNVVSSPIPPVNLIALPQPPTNCGFSVTQNNFSLNYIGGERSFTVNANPNCEWTPVSSAPWLRIIEPVSVNGSQPVARGTRNVIFRVEQNPLGTPRSPAGTISVGGQTVTVTQEGDCSFNLSPAVFENVPITGRTGMALNINIKAGCRWDVSAHSASISITSPSTGEGPGVVIFNVAPNPGAYRPLFIELRNRSELLNQTSEVRFQQNGNCNPGVEPGTITVPSAGTNTARLNVTADARCTWEITTNRPWIRFSESGGTGDARIALTVDPNTEPERTATIFVGGVPVTLTQANGCAYTLSRPQSVITGAGGELHFDVSTGNGCTWTPSSSTSWITVRQNNPPNPNRVTLDIAENFDSNGRSGTVTIEGYGATVGQFTVQQNPVCTYALSSREIYLTAEGTSSGNFAVSTQDDCPVVPVVSSEFPWITVPQTGGNGTINYSILPNTTANNGTVRPRAGKIFITSRGNQASINTQEFNVVQRAPQQYLLTAFDADTDKKADLTVFRPADGNWFTVNSTNGAYSSVQWGTATDRIAPGDYIGDERMDYAVWRPTGFNNSTFPYLLAYDNYTNTVQAIGFPDFTANDILTPGNWDIGGTNFDKKWEVGIYRPAANSEENGKFIYRKLDGGRTQITIGISGDKPVPADFEGNDGKTDAAVFKPETGIWTIRKTDGALRTVQFGQSGDIPVPADYDGDGQADVAVYRPSNGTWYLLRSALGFTAIQFGVSSDIPVTADYDGDGRADIGVFRPSNGTWYLLRSSTGFGAAQWGMFTDRTIPSAYQH